MKRYKGVIIFLIIVVVYTGVMLLLYFSQDHSESTPKDNPNNPNNPSNPANPSDPTPTDAEIEYLVIGDESNWQLVNNEWKTASKKSIEKEKMTVYIDGLKLGNYYLKSGNVWNIFDDNNKYINYDGKLLAHSNNMNLSVKTLTQSTMGDAELNNLKTILNKDVMLSDVVYSEVYNVKINNNDLVDKLVFASNVDNFTDSEFYFNVIYADIDGNIVSIIKEDIEPKDLLISPRYSIEYVLNIDNSNYSSIIINRQFFSNVGETGNILYSYDNNSYKISIKNNQ